MGAFHEERRKMRFEQVERMLASDATVAEWCRLNHAAESTMYHWLKVYRERNGGDGKRNGWIELDREDIRKSKALAFASSAIASGGTCADIADPACPPQPYSGVIKIRANGFEADIPAGAAQADVEVVLKAVASL